MEFGTRNSAVGIVCGPDAESPEERECKVRGAECGMGMISRVQL